MVFFAFCASKEILAFFWIFQYNKLNIFMLGEVYIFPEGQLIDKRYELCI